MEEKIAKQQVLKKNFEDRKRGIDAIISRTENSDSKIELLLKDIPKNRFRV